LEGLLGKSKLLNMEIKSIPEKGRGVFVNESVPAGSFVVEYKTARVYPRSERDQYEAMYTLNAEPCMVLDVQTPQGWQCLDATRKFGTLGRLLNHAASCQGNCKALQTSTG